MLLRTVVPVASVLRTRVPLQRRLLATGRSPADHVHDVLAEANLDADGEPFKQQAGETAEPETVVYRDEL